MARARARCAASGRPATEGSEKAKQTEVFDRSAWSAQSGRAQALSAIQSYMTRAFSAVRRCVSAAPPIAATHFRQLR